VRTALPLKIPVIREIYRESEPLVALPICISHGQSWVFAKMGLSVLNFFRDLFPSEQGIVNLITEEFQTVPGRWVLIGSNSSCRHRRTEKKGRVLNNGMLCEALRLWKNCHLFRRLSSIPDPSRRPSLAPVRLWATFSIGALSRRPGAEFLSCQRRSRKFKVAGRLCPVDFSTHRIENVFRVETIGTSDPLRPAIFVRRCWVSNVSYGP
jgi:hypothetical protein